MSAEQQLAILPAKEVALAVFSAPNGLDPYLQSVREEIDKFNASAPDVKTKKGQDAYRSIAYSLAGSKTKLDSLGKELVAELKDVPKKIDAERKRVRELLSAWQEEVRKPLTDWEAAEQARKDRHVDAVQAIADFALDLSDVTAAVLLESIASVEAVKMGEHWEEFEADAARTKDQVLDKLRATLATRQKYEAEQAELVRLRAEAEAQAQRDRDAEIARVAAEQARIQAEQRAQAERDAAARREQELLDQAAAAQRATEQAARDAEAAVERHRLQLELQAEQAERHAAQAKADQLAAEQRAEQERLASIRRQEEAVERARLDEVARANAAADEILRQQQERQADVAHKSKILGEAKQALIGMNISEELAKAIVLKIARGEVPNVSIQF
ncbi:MAG TPA: hypothetical protein K8W20_06595 [Pseudomonas lactis]|uniref:Uncharacterized protein n=1 Tax=Pseudomonas lactis TaxID=1615674 RepID=A0A921NFK6_9PSED|nr:hypothetical protein [Pseudomonas lactis]HJH18363.1 hypothetical protein [Pseudomonas lactis]